MHLTALRYRILKTFQQERSSILLESVLVRRTETKPEMLRPVLNKLVIEGMFTVCRVRVRGNTFDRQYTATPQGWDFICRMRRQSREQINAQQGASR